MICAVLAGGRGRRLGGAKPHAPLGGRPLVARPVDAARAAGLEPVLVAKPDTDLPALGITVVRDGHPVHHPLAGVVAALEHAAGPVVVVGADMPFLDALTLRALAGAPAGPVAAARAGGEWEPLCARYAPEILAELRAALEARAPMRATLAGLRPVAVDVDRAAIVNVNSPADLAAAEARLSRTPPCPR